MAEIEVFTSVSGAQMQTLVECPECYAVVTWRRVPEHAEWHESGQEMPDLTDIKDRLRGLDDSVHNIERDIDELDQVVSGLNAKEQERS